MRSGQEQRPEQEQDVPVEIRRAAKRHAAGGAGRLAPPLEVVRLVDVGVDAVGRIEGHAALFHKFNQHNDRIIPGAFARTIRERHEEPLSRAQPSRLKINFMHQRATPLALPVEVREDTSGLWTVSQVIDPKGVNAWRLEAIRSGAVDGLSIEFNPWKTVGRELLPREYRREDLGNPDDWWFPPVELQDCELLGWGFVGHPSADDARVEAVREIAADFARILVPGWRPDAPASPPADPAARELRAWADELSTQRQHAQASELDAWAAELRSRTP